MRANGKRIARGLVGCLGLGLWLVGGTALAGATQSSFTPSAYKYPIMKISLARADGSNEQVIYTCPSTTAADCLVDVADPAALTTLQNSLQNVSIQAGTYNTLNLQSCPAGTTGLTTMSVEVKGQVSVSGTNFVTSASSPGGMVAGTTPEATSVSLGCGGAHVTLIQPLVIAEDQEVTATLLVDLTNVTWTDANASSGMGGCKAGAGQDICTTFPFIVPYLGSGTPTFERYLISHLSSAGTPPLDGANGIVSLAVDESNQVFYISGTPFYSPTSPTSGDPTAGGPDYNAATRTFVRNTDGTLAFATGGDVNDNRVGFSAFQRATHTGVCKNELPASPNWNYKAYKQ